MDVLSNVLDVTQMDNTVLCRATLLAPWAIAVDASIEATLHVIQQGSCWLRVEGEKAIQVSSGDIVLLARGSGHIISDTPNRRAKPFAEVLAIMAERAAQEGEKPETLSAHVLCAKYRFGLPGVHPLLSRLPKLIHLRARDVAKNAPLQLLIQLMQIETEVGGDGGDIVVPRLIDSLLVFILRAWLEYEPDLSASWFAALRDQSIGKALKLIHHDPQKAWTVGVLAQSVGQTRATFARRFAHLVGETPVAYLTRWRLCLAAKMLKDEGATVEQAAYPAGFESAATFSRAFKRQYGIPPAKFRSLHERRSQVGRIGAAA